MFELQAEQLRSLLAALSYTVGIGALLFLLRRGRTSLRKARALLAIDPAPQLAKIREELSAVDEREMLRRRRRSLRFTRGSLPSAEQRAELSSISARQALAIGRELR